MNFPDKYHREMGYTPREFMRTLPSALHSYDFTVVANGADIQIEHLSQPITIRIGEEKLRKIALMRLPYIDVDFDFAGLEPEKVTALMAQFDLYFKKGGG